MAVLGSEPEDLAAIRSFQANTDIILDQGFETGDPDKAAKAIQLAQASNIPANQILTDVDTYDTSAKKELSRTLVQSSEAMQRYLNADPMATHVSSDDWANIWDYGRFLDRLWNGPMSAEQRKKVAYAPLADIRPSHLYEVGKGNIEAMWEATTHGLWEGAKALPKAAGVMKPESEIVKSILEMADKKMEEEGWNPYVRAATMSLLERQGGLAEAALGVSPWIISGLLRLPMWTAIAGMPISGLIHQNVSKPVEEKFGIPASYTDAVVMVAGLILGFKHLRDMRIEGTRIKKLEDAVRQADPYARMERTPPVGINDTIDHLHTKAAEREAEMVKDTMAAAGKVQTQERSPDLGVKFANGIIGDRYIEIDGEAVLKLYGDKTPEPGDGLLGFVPDLREQLARHQKDGGPIRIRGDEYFGRVDKEVHKSLADDLRIDPDGMTPNQAKARKGAGDGPEPRAFIAPEDGFWAVYLDGVKVKTLITRQAAEEYLAQVAPEQSLEGGLKRSAGIGEVDYELSATDQIDITPSTMFGRLVLKLPKAILDRIEKLRLRNEEARQERQLAKAAKRIKDEQAPLWQERFDEQLSQTWDDMKD